MFALQGLAAVEQKAVIVLAKYFIWFCKGPPTAPEDVEAVGRIGPDSRVVLHAPGSPPVGDSSVHVLACDDVVPSRVQHSMSSRLGLLNLSATVEKEFGLARYMVFLKLWHHPRASMNVKYKA